MAFELVNGLWVPAPAKPKGEKNISIFLDESYDERQESVYVVAGYIGAEHNWKDFPSDWKAVMTDCGLDGVTFHSTLFFHGCEEPWKSLKKDTERFKAMLNGLLDVIRDNRVYPFGAMLLMKEYAASKNILTCDDPYELCLEFALYAAAEICEVAEGGSIKFVCDENQAISKSVLRAFNEMKDEKPELKTIFSTLEFGTDDDNPELCAADLLAFEVRKNVYNTIHNPGVPIRYPLTRIMADGPYHFKRVDFTPLLGREGVWNPGQ